MYSQLLLLFLFIYLFTGTVIQLIYSSFVLLGLSTRDCIVQHDIAWHTIWHDYVHPDNPKPAVAIPCILVRVPKFK